MQDISTQDLSIATGGNGCRPVPPAWRRPWGPPPGRPMPAWGWPGYGYGYGYGYGPGPRVPPRWYW